ncbi:MAG TPA: hypothetical protein VGC54_09220 [Planctomycetota bacterium]
MFHAQAALAPFLAAALMPAVGALQLGGAAAGGLADVLVTAALRYVVVVVAGLFVASWVLEFVWTRAGSARR